MQASSTGTETTVQPVLEELLSEARQSAKQQLAVLEGDLQRAREIGAPTEVPALFEEAEREVARLSEFVSSASYEELTKAEEMASRAKDRIDRSVAKTRAVRAARRWRAGEQAQARNRLILAVAAVTVFYGAWILALAAIATAIWPYAYLFVFGLVAAYILMLWWQAPLIVRFQMSCRDLSDEQRRRVEPIVVELAARAGLPAPRTAVAAVAEPNAFAVGRAGNSAIIFTSAALQELDETDLRGLIGHELGHIASNDGVWLAFFLALGDAAGWIATAADWLLVAADRLTSEILSSDEADGSGMGAIMTMFVLALKLTIWASLLIIRILFYVSDGVARLAMQAQSRGQEFIADAFAAELGQGEELARALVRMDGPAAPTDCGSGQPILSRLFASHPPTAERLAKLEAIEQSI